MKQLRDYQKIAIQRIYDYWLSGGVNGLVVIPTGGGKSLIMAQFIGEIVEKYKGTRILVLTHRKELIDQNEKEFLELYPNEFTGVFSASLKRKENKQILFAGIQSVEKHIDTLDPFEIVIIDEAHMIPRTDGTRYKQALTKLKEKYKHLKVVGLSATPYRLDSGWLHKGEGAFFDGIIYERPVQELIDEGYLVPPVPYRGEVTIDTKGLHKLGKEWKAGELEARAMEGDTTARAIHDIVTKGKDRKSWLIFASGVKHAYQIKEHLDRYDIPSAVVIGNEPRDKSILDFKLGILRCLINVDVLTTGFNHPGVDLLALLRPTESCGLYVQIIGRGMRTSEGKEDCLVLDYAGVTLRHGPIDSVNPDAPAKTGEGIAPAKECPDCGYIMHTAKRVCPKCGYVYPVIEKKLDTEASRASLLKADSNVFELDITGVKYSIHEKPGRPDCIKVIYQTRFTDVYDWIHPEATDQRAWFYFDRWCKEAGILPPHSAWEFLKTSPRKPVRIRVVRNGKYFKVVGRCW